MAVEIGVLLWAIKGRHRFALTGQNSAGDIVVAKMARDKDHPAPLGLRGQNRGHARAKYRRIRDNETADSKFITPLFCEDTHTEPEPEDRYEVTLPLYHQQLLSFPTLYIMRKLPPLKLPPPNYPVPSVHIIATFIENIRQKARLTPQSMVITLIYIDRLEARSEGVLLHARSWRPVVFASLLLASKVWHDISYSRTLIPWP